MGVRSRREYEGEAFKYFAGISKCGGEGISTTYNSIQLSIIGNTHYIAFSVLSAIGNTQLFSKIGNGRVIFLGILRGGQMRGQKL